MSTPRPAGPPVARPGGGPSGGGPCDDGRSDDGPSGGGPSGGGSTDDGRSAERRPELPVARHLRRAALTGLALLLGLVGGWCLEGGITLGRIALALVLTSPLWLAVRGLHRGHRRTYAWMTLAVVPYLALALMEVVANPHARAWATAWLLVCFLLFILLVGYLRVTRPTAR